MRAVKAGLGGVSLAGQQTARGYAALLNVVHARWENGPGRRADPRAADRVASISFSAECTTLDCTTSQHTVAVGTGSGAAGGVALLVTKCEVGR
ncbi:hypothetical protein NDU88_002380 [Pleurodeles waltl]|uniref:Uncharacterized protein n=1 Tax=Pleurodeles waltl TaxID=8319 RepID=A0AAV7M366_PLEWA|nr:hypothetical protein NDU88_002380 [Pleurodeles waltl]